MWTYAGARRKEKRNSLWAWTAPLEERDGSRGLDFEVGGSDESTFMRLLERLPDAECYETNSCMVYEWLSRNKHMLRKYGAVNWNECLRTSSNSLTLKSENTTY